jgi:putative flippase GtrA
MDSILRRLQQRSLTSWVAARFALVGLSGAAVYFALLRGLVELGNVRPLIASSFAFALVVVENYLLHRRWTFASRVPHRQALPRFVVMACCGGTVNGTVMAVFLRLGWHYLLAQTMALAVVIACNFVGTFLIFRGRGLTRRSVLTGGPDDASE